MVETRNKIINLDPLAKVHIYYVIGIIGFTLAIYVTLTVGLWWWFICSFVYCKLILLLGAQIAHHRYFTHNSFKTSTFKHKLLCWFSFLSTQGSPIMWFIQHHHHHLHSDTKLDLHSPINGKWGALIWNLQPSSYYVQKQVNIFPRHLYRDKTINFIHNNYFKLWCIFGAVGFLLGWKFFLFFILMPIGHNLITGVFLNMAFHTKLPYSYKTFPSNDHSYNSKLLVSISIGEGFHNNHHMYPSEYNHAMLPGEFDPAAWVIKHCFLLSGKVSK